VRCALVMWIAALSVACGHGAASLYGAERLACVEANDAAEPARACMRDVDTKWGQDGGLR
jgi:hypothetical protein